MYNTIILLKGEDRISKEDFENFEPGETIWGDNAEPVELARWVAEDEEEAKAALAEHNCTTSYGELQKIYSVEEYALEYCTYNEDGDFVEGSDYDLAESK